MLTLTSGIEAVKRMQGHRIARFVFDGRKVVPVYENLDDQGLELEPITYVSSKRAVVFHAAVSADAVSPPRTLDDVTQVGSVGGLLFIPGQISREFEDARKMAVESMRKGSNYDALYRVREQQELIKYALLRGQPILAACAGSWALFQGIGRSFGIHKDDQSAADFAADNLGDGLQKVTGHAARQMVRCNANGEVVYNTLMHDVIYTPDPSDPSMQSLVAMGTTPASDLEKQLAPIHDALHRLKKCNTGRVTSWVSRHIRNLGKALTSLLKVTTGMLAADDATLDTTDGASASNASGQVGAQAGALNALLEDVKEAKQAHERVDACAKARKDYKVLLRELEHVVGRVSCGIWAVLAGAPPSAANRDVNSVHSFAPVLEDLPSAAQDHVLVSARAETQTENNWHVNGGRTFSSGTVEAFETRAGAPVVGVLWHFEADHIDSNVLPSTVRKDNRSLIQYMMMAGIQFARKQHMQRDLLAYMEDVIITSPATIAIADDADGNNEAGPSSSITPE